MGTTLTSTHQFIDRTACANAASCASAPAFHFFFTHFGLNSPGSRSASATATHRRCADKGRDHYRPPKQGATVCVRGHHNHRRLRSLCFSAVVVSYATGIRASPSDVEGARQDCVDAPLTAIAAATSCRLSAVGIGTLLQETAGRESHYWHRTRVCSHDGASRSRCAAAAAPAAGCAATHRSRSRGRSCSHLGELVCGGGDGHDVL